MTRQFDTLKDIASGSPITTLERTDMFGQKFIDNSEMWLNENKNLSPDIKLEEWLLKNKDWSFTPNNKQYYWDTLENLSPGNTTQVRSTVMGGIREKLDAFSTLEDKENYFRDKAHTWPEYVHKDLEGYFFGLKNINDRKNLDKTRLAQIMEVDGLNADRIPSLKLAPDVSLETHTREYIKAYDLGFSDMKTNAEGRITVPVGGQDVPVFTLEDPKLSLEEEFISLNDLTHRTRVALKPVLEQQREEVKKAERLANIALLNRVERGNIPDEFQANIIIDGVILEDDPIQKTKQTINTIILNKINKGEFAKGGEVARSFFALYKDIHNKLARRMQDGNQ